MSTQQLRRVQQGAAMTGVAAFLVMTAAGDNKARALQSFLFGYLFWIGIALGCFALLMLHHLVGGGWGKAMRRILEAGTRTIPIMALLFIPVLLQLPDIYEWARPEAEADEVLRHKAAYLNATFFTVRTVFYFAVWLLLGWLLNKWSDEQARGTAGMKGRLQGLSGPGLILYGLTASFASIDWAMSLEPHWYSTIYGVMFMVGQALATLAFVLVVLMLLGRGSASSEIHASETPPSHFHDIGTLMFAFVMLWAYVSFSQFLIIWAGNLPEETPWYIRRLEGGWGWIAGVLVVFHFALPFLLLLSRTLKKRIGFLGPVAMGMFAVRILDMYWMLGPAFEHGELKVVLSDLLAPIAVGGLWLAFFVWQLKRRPLTPVESLS